MSRIEKLAIRGIRSFDPQEEVKIEFFRPLTLIQGHNGSGKTTIIECLKMASCGSLPPLATNGKTFINDPKINGATETKASIKLKFLTPRNKEVLVIRNFQLTLKNTKYEFKRLEQLLKSYNSNGELVTINSTCVDIDKQVPLLMHASKAIIENVIFCHQEETNWPFTEAGNLKKVFDEIFDTAKYTKALEDLKDINKQYTTKAKEFKIKIELMQKDYEQYKKLNNNVDNTNLKIEEIKIIVHDLLENIQKADKDYKQIIEYEDQFRQKEQEIVFTKMKIEEKNKQILTLKNDPFFQDFTENEEEYQNFIQNFQNNHNNNLNNVNNLTYKQTQISNIQNNLQNFNNDLRNLNEEINTIDATIISGNHIKNNVIEKKNFIVYNLNQIDLFENKFSNSQNFSEILESLAGRKIEFEEKLNMMDEKKKIFENKLSEKMNEYEVERVLNENRRKEFELLVNRKSEMIRNLNNQNNSIIQLTEINDKIYKTQEDINSINTDDIEHQIFQEQKLFDNLMEKINNFPKEFKNSEKLFFYIESIKESLNKLKSLDNLAREKIQQFNQAFKMNLSATHENQINSLSELIKFINDKKEQIIEEKQNIREQNLTINTQIEMCEKNLKKLNDEILYNLKLQENLFNEIKYLFEKLNIPLTNCVNESGNNFDQNISNISNDINNLIIFKNELESLLKTLNQEKSSKQLEVKFLEEYISNIQDESECAFCFKQATKDEIISIKKNMQDKIIELTKANNERKIKVEDKSQILEEILKVDLILKKLLSVIEENKKNLLRQKELENELNNYLKERKYFESSSKEKTILIVQLESFLGKGSSHNEEIFKLKSDLIEVNIKLTKWCEYLIINKENIYSIDNIYSILDEKFKLLQEYSQLEEQIKITKSSIQEKQNLKSKLFERKNKLFSDLRIFEIEKKRLSQYSDTNELNKKIFETDAEITIKKTELEKSQEDLKQLFEIKNILNNKKLEFESIYYDKRKKYATLLDRINNFTIQIQINIQDIQRITNNNENPNISIEEHFNLNLINMTREKQMKEKLKNTTEKEIQKIREELIIQEDDERKNQMKEKLYKNNILIYALKDELKQLNDYLIKNENKVTLNNKITSAKDKIADKLNVLNSQYNLNLGKIYELNNNLNKLTTELKNEIYYDIEDRYNKIKVEYILSIETGKQVENYYEALDQSLLKYHAKRMEEINKLINYYWSMTYKGNDIKWIELRSDVEKTIRSRSYNYRIVYGTQEDQEMDMRGRCSAGQKVLASIIIRLALAETFCNNCGILCLDEPTTNLDEIHIKSLAKALREIIQSRTEDQNFQLIVITHDSTFVDLIGSDCCDSYWNVSKRDGKFSKIELKPINSIFQ